jgi:two-component system, OmpR family, alkaline phosphatase synthesis response regulator PhoP
MSPRSALVIDDEPDITTYIGMVLSDNGWTVRTANSAADGLEFARQQAPDVILLDVMMPEKGGLSTLVALRKDPNLKSVPVVLVTGIQDTLTQDFEAYLGRIKNYHPDAYMEKPVEPERLLALLDQVVGPEN